MGQPHCWNRELFLTAQSFTQMALSRQNSRLTSGSLPKFETIFKKHSDTTVWWLTRGAHWALLSLCQSSLVRLLKGLWISSLLVPAKSSKPWCIEFITFTDYFIVFWIDRRRKTYIAYKGQISKSSDFMVVIRTESFHQHVRKSDDHAVVHFKKWTSISALNFDLLLKLTGNWDGFLFLNVKFHF